jgi:SulP family sulfate permease
VTGLGIALSGGAAHGVALVRDLSRIPHGLPGPRLPQPALMDDLFSAALAIAVLGLVQTAALAHSIKEPDGRTPDASREFMGQGLGNLAGALVQSMPAGGSLSRTAVNINAGARTRWANVWAGVFVALIMLLFGSLVERIPLAALAGHLIVAAGSLISLPRLRFVWRASWAGRWAMTATFASTLILPLQYSVYVGVFLSLSLYVHQSSRVMIVQLEPVGDNLFREVPLSQTLPDGQPVILSIHGNLFFAAMRDLEQRLPSPNGTQCPVVILRLRGDTLLAGTGASMLAAYAERLRAQGGKLILCGVEKPVLETLKRTGTLDKIGGENVFPANELLLASVQAALEYAQTWLAEQSAAVT